LEITPKDTTGGAAATAPTSLRQIGQYQVIGKLGAGGMGEVYRARDAKLGRDVALKLLPATLAHDGHSLARLEREARTLASLNHPNIAAIYGLEEAEGLRALVMELVEGETLSEHIHGPSGAGEKPLPPEEALPIARQIAEALEYAHERGVIHRDLKPANVKITPEGTVKVLDFGLAKVLSDQDSSASSIPPNSPTLSLMATQAGIILGTAAYMAPEQAKGKQVDRRADIWAFGCVLYEMLAGKKTFEGETISDVLAAVIRGEPDWTALPATMPPAIRRLIRRCLQKDLRQRLQAIGDARIAIEETISGAGADADAATPAASIAETKRTSRLRRALPWALGAVAILFAGIAAWLQLKPQPHQNVIRFPVPPPEGADFIYGGEMSISPDGRTLAFIAQAGPDKPPTLWLRPLDSMVAQAIPGTEGANGSFWSPDGQQIGFQAGGKLEKIAAAGGTPVVLCDEDVPFGTWNKDGVILFTNHNKIFSVPDTGGAPSLVAAPDAAHGEFFQFPQFLPDGRHFIVQVRTGAPGEDYIAAGSLDSKTVERLTPATTDAIYAPPGYLFYMDQNTLMARPFNAKALRFTGGAVPVAQNVGMFSNAFYGFFNVSPAGVLAYETVPATSTNQLTWFSRAGQKLGTVGQPDVYATPALSPDGSKLAVAVGSLGKHNLWVYDLKRGTGSRLTIDSADDVNPVWSQDGSRVLFSSNRAGVYDIYQQASDGLGSAQPVIQSKDQVKYLNDLTADGRYAIFDSGGASNDTALWTQPLFGDRKPSAFIGGGLRAISAQFSPNGHYVVYTSSETGRNEIYVQTFPQQTGKWQISASGGTDPIWRRDGKELFFLAPDEKLMAVDVNTASATLQAGIPKELFQAQTIPPWYWRNIYVPSADGQRFLMLTPASEAKPEPITVVVNWPAMLTSGSK
jgi:Tol biopolymer transport system component/tRNA A-37 threonylcarbamoyl transferase component Bud32